MQGTNNDIFLLVEKLLVNAKSPNGTDRTLMDIVETVPVAIIEALSMVAVVNMLGRRPEPVLIPNYPRLPQFLVHQVQFLLGGQPPVEKATTMAARYQILGFPPLEPSQNIAHFVCHLPIVVEDKPTTGATFPYPIVPWFLLIVEFSRLNIFLPVLRLLVNAETPNGTDRIIIIVIARSL